MNKLQTTAPAVSPALLFSTEQKELIKNTVAKGATDNELALFLHLAQTYSLDPFAKEIWCIKYRTTDPATIMTSRDGYLKIANLHPAMDSLVSDTVCENDEVEKQTDGSVIVRYGRPRGAVVGAYALVYRTDRSRPVYAYAPLNEYKGSSPIWSKYPSAMILKVAESMALKRSFSISGLVTQEEIDMEQRAEAGTSAEVVEPQPQLTPAPVEQAAAPVVAYATAAQKEEIIRLINFPVITEQEKTKMLLNLSNLDKNRAALAIVKLHEAIEKRSEQELAAAPEAEYVVVGSAEFVAPPAVEAAPAQEPMISNEQMTELTRLLNHPTITRPEKTKILLNINRLTAAQAEAKMSELRGKIQEREGVIRPSQEELDAIEAERFEASKQLGNYLEEHQDTLPKQDWRRLGDVLEVEANATVPELQAALAEAQQIVAGLGKPEAAPAEPASTSPVPSGGAAPSSTPASSGKVSDATVNKILHILTSHHITEEERTQMFQNVRGFSEERAEQALTKLETTIDTRTAREAFRAYANKHAAKLGQKAHEQAMKRCESQTATAAEFKNELEALEAFIEQKQAA